MDKEIRHTLLSENDGRLANSPVHGEDVRRSIICVSEIRLPKELRNTAAAAVVITLRTYCLGSIETVRRFHNYVRPRARGL